MAVLLPEGQYCGLKKDSYEFPPPVAPIARSDGLVVVLGDSGYGALRGAVVMSAAECALPIDKVTLPKEILLDVPQGDLTLPVLLLPNPK